MVIHPIDPVWDESSELLILGSFPSVASRGAGFYYAHPQNRFWRVLELVYGDSIPPDPEGKKKWLLAHRIALWDVIASCEITGSADSAIRQAVPNDLTGLLQNSRITRIFVNGRMAQTLYIRYMESYYKKKACYLPSTSPANAAFGMERLLNAWRQVRTDESEKENE